ncbi:MAG TPA: toxin-antitoxin system HicB family antitoxin [Nodularia sp. (in: cyanobacteria)]|nr:toxin-antitoxin system HicB family antitoxin [Nodularia sp. (in: cyanobacteria)]
MRLPDDKHNRLKELAQAKGISINKLIEELSTTALAEFDANTRFKAMAAMGNSEEGLRILAKLDAQL